MTEIRYFKNAQEQVEELFDANGGIKRSIQSYLKANPAYIVQLPNNVVFDLEQKKLARVDKTIFSILLLQSVLEQLFPFLP